MVTLTKIDQSFAQQQSSCVLASYGIVSNYFTSQPVTSVFTAYCDHFGINYNGLVDAENISGIHLNNTCRSRGWSGYRMIEDLHLHSNELTFRNNRTGFSVEIIFYSSSQKGRLTSAQIKRINAILKNNEALANIITVNQGLIHSVTVGVDNTTKKEILHNTGANPRLVQVNLSSINLNVPEVILYNRIQRNWLMKLIHTIQTNM